MRTIVRIAVLAAWLVTFFAWTLPAQAHEVAEPATPGKSLLSAEDRKAYRAAFRQVGKKRYRRARKLAKKATDPLPAKVIQWIFLAGDAPRGTFSEIAGFLNENPEWPGQAALLRNAELTMPADLPDARLIAWFEARPPITPAGAVRYAEARMRAGE